MSSHQGRLDALTARILRYIPTPIAESPERVLVNVALILVGLTTIFVDRPGSLTEVWPPWLVIEWGLSLVVGAGCALVSYWRIQPRLGRFGHAVLFVTAAFYAVVAPIVLGWPGSFVGMVYGAISLAMLIRLLVSTAARHAVFTYGAIIDRQRAKEIEDAENAQGDQDG